MNMSVKNDIIALNEVVKQTTDLLREQSTSWKSIVDEIKKINQSAPSSYIKMQKELADSIAKAEQVEQRYQATLSKRTQLQNKINTDVQKILNTGSSLAKQKEKEIALEAKRQAQLEKSTNTYQKVQDRVRQLTQTYNDLATRQALGQRLDAQQLSQLAKLEGQLQAYDKILKQVDATIGKNQRNVGNYASGFDSLGNSINQITRELPAFTFSAQTGFLALSNNIPMLADEIKRVSANVKEMREKGEQVPGVMEQILTSFLSWQTALSLAVTLITVYGEEIGEFFNKIIDGSKKIDSATQALNAYNEALKSGEYTKAYEDVTRVGLAFEQAEKGTLSKEKALKLYNETLGDSIGEAKTYNEALNKYNENSENYIQATLKMAVAQSFLEKAAIASAKAVDLGSEKAFTIGEKFKAFWDNLNEKRGEDDEYSRVFYIALPQAIKGMLEAGKANNIYTKAIENRQKEMAKANKEEKSAIDLAKQMMSEYNSLTNSFTGGNEKEKKKKDTTEKDRLEALRQQLELDYKLANQLIENQIKVTENQAEQMTLRQQQLMLWYAFEIAKAKENQTQIDIINAEFKGKIIELNKEEIKASNDKFDKKTKAEEKNAEVVKKAWKGVTDFIKKQLDEQVKADAEANQRRKENFKDFATGGFSFQSLGFGSLDIFQDQKFMEDFWKTMGDDSVSSMEKAAAATRMFGEIAKDVFNNIAERQNAYYERQFANLDKEKEVALQFAGESATGREAIERQYEEKKVALQREQVKKQKQIAIFSAIINIAQGITASLAQGGPAGIILAALVGVLGAVQIASIANTPLPAFEKGTSNAPQGWAITQEKGAEMITDKNGNIKTLGNNKGNQLTYLNKGDKVYTADETTKRINEMLLGTGVAPIVSTNVSSGLTKDEMLEVMHQTLSKQPKTSVVFDQYGYNLYQEKKNSRTNIKNRNAKI